MVSQRDIVLIPYPFSDLTQSKYRPAIVISNDTYNKKFNDFIAVPLTTNPKTRDHTIHVSSREMEAGSIRDSVAKVDKIFNLEQKLVVKVYGKLRRNVLEDIRKELFKILS